MALDKELKNKSLAPKELGKGRKCLVLHWNGNLRGKATSVALHDCDIITYDKRLLAKLFLPRSQSLF